MVYPDSHTASFFNYPVFISVFMRRAYFCAERSPALGQETLGQEVLEQEALLRFLQSPGVPYVISL